MMITPTRQFRPAAPPLKRPGRTCLWILSRDSKPDGALQTATVAQMHESWEQDDSCRAHR